MSDQNDFNYGLIFDDKLRADMMKHQLTLQETDAVLGYRIDPVLQDRLIIARRLPENYVPLMVAMAFYEDINGTAYFGVYQQLGEELSIAPNFLIEIGDTQFTDSQVLSPGRTIIGSVLNKFTDSEPEIDHDDAFQLIDDTLVFFFEIKTKDDSVDKKPFAIDNYDASIGRVKASEVIEDHGDYTKTSVLVAQYIQAKLDAKQVKPE